MKTGGKRVTPKNALAARMSSAYRPVAHSTPLRLRTQCGHVPSHHFDYAMQVFDFIGALGGIRTPDPQIRSLVLYPAELRAPESFVTKSALEFHLSFARPDPSCRDLV